MAETMPELTGVLRIIDKATAPLKVIAAQIRGVGAAAHAAGEETEHLHHPHVWESLHENVDLLHEHFGELRASIGETNESLTELLPMLAAFGEAAAVAGLVEMVEHVASARVQLLATATSIGITAEQLETLNYTAAMTGVPLEAMQSAAAKLEKNLGAAVTGKSKLAVELFAHMHIALRDAHHQTRSVTDILPQLADAFSHTHDKAVLALAVTTLFGKAGQSLLPMLLRGKEAMKEFGEQAEKINYAFTPEDDENLEKFHQSWTGLTLAAEAFENQVGSKLAPVLTPILLALTGWVTANRDWLATNIVSGVEQLVSWCQQLVAAMRGIDWGSVTTQAMNWGHALGGVQTAMIGLLVLLGSPLLIGFVAALRAVEHLAGGLLAIGRVIYAVAGALIGPMVAAIGEFVLALRLGFTAVEALGLVFASNPLGLVLVALALVIVAGYEVWKHWTAIKAGFEALWVGLVALWRSNVGFIRTISELLFLPAEEIILHWTPIKAFFVSLWDGVAGAFRSGWTYVSGIIGQLQGAIDWVANSWVGQGISAAVGAVAGVAQADYAGASAAVGQVTGGVRQAVSPLASNLDTLYGVQPADQPLGGPRAIPSPYAAPAVAGPGGAAGANGKTETVIRFEGLPPGATVTTTASGQAEAPRVDLGQNYPAGRAFAR